MPDLKNAAEVGSNMNGCLIWALMGLFLFIGVSIGSTYLIFMSLLVGGAMLGGKLISGNKNVSRSSSTQLPSKEHVEVNEFYDNSKRKLAVWDGSQWIGKEYPIVIDNNKESGNSINTNKINMKLHSEISSMSPSTQPKSNTINSSKKFNSELISQLERIADLRKNEYLSEKEYVEMKANIISQLTSIGTAGADSRIIGKKNIKPSPQNNSNNKFSAEDLI